MLLCSGWSNEPNIPSNISRVLRAPALCPQKYKPPARAKNRPCQHHYQPCNRTCQIPCPETRAIKRAVVHTLANPLLEQKIARANITINRAIARAKFHVRRHVRSNVRLSTHLQIPSLSKKSHVPTSLSTVQSHVPHRNFVVATATLVAVSFCFHNITLSCFYYLP